MKSLHVEFDGAPKSIAAIAVLFLAQVAGNRAFPQGGKRVCCATGCTRLLIYLFAGRDHNTGRICAAGCCRHCKLLCGLLQQLSSPAARIDCRCILACSYPGADGLGQRCWVGPSQRLYEESGREGR